MVSAAGRWVLSYNGEIYNYRDLRRRLESAGVAFRGHSDTEVLLAAIEAWGLDRALDEINGMFALAAWDRAGRRLHLSRDRLGEKPLYYGWQGPVLYFGSELKALHAHPDFRPELDRESLALFLRYNCVPVPRSIYRGINKLPPGTSVSFDGPAHVGHLPEPNAYWSLSDVVARGRANRLDLSAQEATDELERRLGDAVTSRMEADVPLGAFLSGGIDSSTIVALMQAHSDRRVRTFTIGFDLPGWDESADAAKVAAHLGTEHTDLKVTAAETLAVIPRLPTLYDEPFADSSQIPTFLVSEMARQHVKVSLSGDGGDEIFGGYNRYTWCEPIWGRIRRVPRGMRRVGAWMLDAVPPSRWDAAISRSGPVLPKRLRVRTPGTKVAKLAEVLPAASLEEMYLALRSHWKDPGALVLGRRDLGSPLPDPDSRLPGIGPVEQMMYLDTLTYLTDDILAKVDRATMAVSLEARVPMLDHRLVEWAWQLPLDLKIREGQGKWLLRQVLYRHVPPALVERPKMGFGLPIGDWLRGPLREWAETLLDEGRLRREGYLEPSLIQARWQEHLTGRREWPFHLWDVLMFQAWLEAN